MATLKAPGIDGFHAQFYQSQWDIEGGSLFSLVLRAFDEGRVDTFLNKTLIVLIPKVDAP